MLTQKTTKSYWPLKLLWFQGLIHNDSAILKQLLTYGMSLSLQTETRKTKNWSPVILFNMAVKECDMPGRYIWYFPTQSGRTTRIPQHWSAKFNHEYVPLAMLHVSRASEEDCASSCSWRETSANPTQSVLLYKNAINCLLCFQHTWPLNKNKN